MVTKTRRNIYFEDLLWSEVVKASAKEQARTGRQVSVAEYIRQAVRERLEREGK